MDDIYFLLNGGRGSSAGNKKFKFGHAEIGEDHSTNDFPARFNAAGRVRSADNTLQRFRSKHAYDNYESAIAAEISVIWI